MIASLAVSEFSSKAFVTGVVETSSVFSCVGARISSSCVMY